MTKSMKPQVSAPSRPMSEDEKTQKVLQFIQQKRENFAINILCNLCRSAEGDTTDLVEAAVAMADKLIQTLYPIPETEEL